MKVPLQPLHTRIVRFAFLTSDGVRLSVLEAKGSVKKRPVMVLVPGWTMPATLWRQQLEALALRYTMVALDPRGQGKSDVPAGGYNIDRRADDIGEFIARYGSVILVAWSLAAIEALQCIHR